MTDTRLRLGEAYDNNLVFLDMKSLRDLRELSYP
jgi:hypothetical protein